MFIFWNAKPKVRKKKDILLRQTLQEFHGLHGDIKPPHNFSLHINEYKGVVQYLKNANLITLGLFLTAYTYSLLVLPQIKTCRTRCRVWIIPQALTEPWYQSLLPQTSKTCLFLNIKFHTNRHSKRNQTLISVCLMKLAIRSLNNINNSNFFYCISAWLYPSSLENKKETRKWSKLVKAWRNLLVAWKVFS